MQAKALTVPPLLLSAATFAASPTIPPNLPPAAVAPLSSPASSQSVSTPALQAAISTGVYSPVSAAVSQWNALRQSDRLPFSSYASFLTRYRGWPGEAGLRKSAERAIDPATSSAGEVLAFFRMYPPLTPTGRARHAFALLSSGQADAAREAARAAWRSGALQRADEDRLLSLFGGALGPADHDRRMEVLLSNRDLDSARRTLLLASPAKRFVYETRIALQSRAPDASSRLAQLAGSADGDPGLLMDQAIWLRDTSQSLAARNLLARPHRLTSQPADVEKWYETMLTIARGAAADKQWTTAYQIASQVDDAYAPGTDVSLQPTGERDDYTSLVWLAGTTALQQLGRPADAAAMFLRYARGGRSTQVLSKGLYWAGRAAQAAGQTAQANAYFAEAAAFPELFYGQLSLERVGQPVPMPPPAASLAAPTPAERVAYQRRDLVEATRLLGQMGRWNDQSLFVRTLAEQASTHSERLLATELSQQIGRPDLRVWLARNARNAGSPFYAREAYPEVFIPPAQSHLWSLAHGIIRQESSFDLAAVSPAGARGMMQLMTPTARHVCSKMGMSCDTSRLTTDSSYNIMLGSSYFAELMDYWGGYAPLAIASYNAGTSNVRKWISANGDPRMPGYDIVRWIEDIPFTETRGYVQRVLENAVVYDALNPSRAGTSPAIRLSYYLGKSSRPG